MSELKYWLWLSSLTGVRPRVKNLILEHYGSPREAYFAPSGEYRTLGGIEERELAALENKKTDAALQIMDACLDGSVDILTLQDAAYPRRLAAVFDPPTVLYVRGRLPAMDEEAAIAIVGTRGATPYGIKMAIRMGYELTKCGGLLVSGLTLGIDAAGARGALLAGGACVGVLGTAIDRELNSLERDVAAVGAIVSEYPPGADAYPSNFRARNRITAGLSVGVVVVEAPAKSGALLFADEATSQGKEIFVVPSNADSQTGAGSNALLKDGAKPVTAGTDVLCEFTARFPDKLREKPPKNITIPTEQESVEPPPSERKKRVTSPETGEGFAILRRPNDKKGIDKQKSLSYIDLKNQLEGLSEAQLAIVSAMNTPSIHVDDLIERSGLSAAAVLSELTLLQIMGFVTQEKGKRFTLNIKQK